MQCVFELKSKYPFVQNHLVIPYLSFNIFDKSIFDSIIHPEGFEKFITISYCFFLLVYVLLFEHHLSY